MGTIHALASFAEGGLGGIQSVQRDWSPYLVHFTNWAAMEPLRSAVIDGKKPSEIRELLREADRKSFEVVRAIQQSRTLRAATPSGKANTPQCVCLSECNIGGLISHCERYGRFGFVFKKSDIFAGGGAPCSYLRREEYEVIRDAFSTSNETAKKRVWGLSNIYCPPGTPNHQIQDYTHEREWRIFSAVDLNTTAVQCILAPAEYLSSLATMVTGIPVIPIDTLYSWGA